MEIKIFLLTLNSEFEYCNMFNIVQYIFSEILIPESACNIITDTEIR